MQVAALVVPVNYRGWNMSAVGRFTAQGTPLLKSVDFWGSFTARDAVLVEAVSHWQNKAHLKSENSSPCAVVFVTVCS